MTRVVAAAPLVGAKRAPQEWSNRIRTELAGNILPFWPRYALDPHGGFYGEVSDDLTVRPKAPRASVVNTRILWTFATAARLIDSKWKQTADWAYAYITRAFIDAEAGGIFWSLDGDGKPLALRKQTYAQAFAIYALSEYYRLTGNAEALETAKTLYALIEAHCYDSELGGYIEARDRDWQPLADMRLSDKDLNSPKSMNTHLHVLEAYTNLLRVWPDETLRARQKALIALMLDRIVDGADAHFKLFFDERWNSMLDHISFGHDIEGSWLLVEAAEVVGDPALLARARATALAMARNCLDHGVDPDGSMLFAADGSGVIIDDTKHWWVQAEAVVGFYNAFQLSGDEEYRDASWRAWNYIETHVVDRIHGEWHAKLTREGVPFRESEDADAVLVGPWKCPYHNARVCYEMLTRLGNEKETP